MLIYAEACESLRDISLCSLQEIGLVNSWITERWSFIRASLAADTDLWRGACWVDGVVQAGLVWQAEDLLSNKQNHMQTSTGVRAQT